MEKVERITVPRGTECDKFTLSSQCSIVGLRIVILRENKHFSVPDYKKYGLKQVLDGNKLICFIITTQITRLGDCK